MADITVGTNYYQSLMETLQSTTGKTNITTDIDRLNKDSTDAELLSACKSFESYFIEQMYKGMEKTIIRDDKNEEGDYVSYFKDTLYKGYADLTVESGGFGIAQILYESMKKNTDI